ncbi:MAG TPA: hypothetical protein VFZ25_20885 [Chloroflexota bacterium]|nr:hypothetical protein [Chloroflexota bacterium]
MRISIAAEIQALLVASVAGCGGGGGSTVAASTPAQKGGAALARYVVDADETCAEHNTEIDREVAAFLAAHKGASQAATESAVVRKVLVPDLEREVRSVRALVLPPADVHRALSFLNAMLVPIRAAKERPAAFVHAAHPFAVPERMGKQFGFSVCGGFTLPSGLAS